LFGKDHATPDGVIFSLSPPDIIQQVERFAGSDEMALSFSVVSTPEVVNSGYFISIEGRGFETEEKGFVALLVKTESDSTVFSADTLYNSDTFAFAGVEGKISFPPNNPPGPGNVFVLETLIPVEPSLLDAYQFAIRGSRTVTEQVAAGLSNIKVVPNPYLVSSLYEQEFGELRREPIRQIQFINLPEECTIYIFTVAGDRVKDLYHNSSGGSLFWDLRSEGGREIATGVYLYVVRAANGAEFLGRFAVIK
jgi:hypothetical protein